MIPKWALAGQNPRTAIRESDLSIRLHNGAEILVSGLDVPERIEGVAVDWICIDEIGNCHAEVWGEHIRPMLSERNGQAWLIGVPEGRNHYWLMSQKAQEDASGLWSFHTWTSATVLPPEEIEIARAELDLRTFRQEYEASFLDATGRVYYGFRRELHAAERLAYDPTLPLVLCFDFNVAPGVCVICQEQQYKGSNPAVASTFTAVINEIWIPSDSNTQRVCREIIERYGNHASDVIAYGDATGGAKGTAKVDGSDWDIVEKMLRPVFGQPRTRPGRGDFECRVPNSNPRERVRINAANSRLQSADGKVHLLIDPRCVHTIQDFEGVTYRQGTSEIDKKSSPMLTHLTDALGYYVNYEFPTTEHPFEVVQF
ncbi:MAG TPA: hypothetical protein P5068_10380 [Sedimentisphaerales bacterium]|nr:hypothetical protein [Sedimentisphaerales bacterium]